MSQDKMEVNTVAINNCLKTLQKTMDKLQSLGVLINATYCLPHSGTAYTVGWKTMSEIVRQAINSKDEEFQNMLKTDYADLNSGTPLSAAQVCSIMPTLPPGKDCCRDQLKPLLLEMIRVSQCQGNYPLVIMCFDQW